MDTRLKRTLLDITDKLRKRNRRFAVIGGVATTILGYLRVTQDVDLIVDSARQLDEALATDIAETLKRIRAAKSN